MTIKKTYRMVSFAAQGRWEVVRDDGVALMLALHGVKGWTGTLEVLKKDFNRFFEETEMQIEMSREELEADRTEIREAIETGESYL